MHGAMKWIKTSYGIGGALPDNSGIECELSDGGVGSFEARKTRTNATARVIRFPITLAITNAFNVHSGPAESAYAIANEAKRKIVKTLVRVNQNFCLRNTTKMELHGAETQTRKSHGAIICMNRPAVLQVSPSIQTARG